MATIELDRTTLKTFCNIADKYAGAANAAYAAIVALGISNRNEAKPYAKAWALARNPLEIFDEHGKPVLDEEGNQKVRPWHNSAAERATLRFLDSLYGPANSVKAENARKGAKDRHASVKVNRALVQRIVNELAGLTKAELNATLAAVRDGIVFE